MPPTMTRSFGALVLMLSAACAVACGARSSLDIFVGSESGSNDSTGESGTGSSMRGGGSAGRDGGAGSSHGSSGSRDASGSDEGGIGGGDGGGGGGGGTVPLPPSCAPRGLGMTNCGTGTESCCTSLEVSGGTFYRTYNPVGLDGGAARALDGGPLGEADLATVSGYHLDKYLVTVGRFRQFVRVWNGGNGYAPAAGSGLHTYLHGGQGLENSGTAGSSGATYEPGWVASDDSFIDLTDENLDYCAEDSTWTSSATTQENLPISCVNWYEAYAFCIWDGGFLPSEAEWEYAAAGGNQQREFPWGATHPGSDSQYAIYGYDNGVDCYFPTPGACTGVANFAAVGTTLAGAGRWGQLDLAGNVAEWNLDWYAPFTDPCVDAAGLTTADFRVIRGGGFDRDAPAILPTYPEGRYPSGRNGDVGFRCARVP